MKQLLILVSVLSFFVTGCTLPDEKTGSTSGYNTMLPRALFITTGISDNNVLMAKGVVIAIQTLNARGVPVRLETRDILYDYEQLSKFNILVLSTFPGYHDADRKYSLSYMTDEELHNINRFVKEGGVMISGDNVGRNFFDGTDRIIKYQKLTPDNWKLSECFGLNLTERNMTGYNIEGEIVNYSKWLNLAKTLTPEGAEKWSLVPDSLFSNDLKILGYWIKDMDSIPALVENKYQKGTSYLLASSGFLHPVNDGGYWSEKQIEEFYNYVLDEYNKENNVSVELNPWPNGKDYAFCVTLNSQGTIDQYKRIFSILKKEDIKPTIFVNGMNDPDIMNFLKSSKYPLASSGYSYSNYQNLRYPESLEDILRNKNYWDIDFSGFRFPYTSPGFWGMLALDKNNYLFESSIGANNLEFIHGSVFPYNIVVANNGYFKSTDILEVAPTYHDDYYFFKDIYNNQNSISTQLEKSSKVYSKYLENYWNYAVKPYKGLMVYLGHPQYVGYNDTTAVSLSHLVSTVSQDKVWIATIDEIARFRKDLSGLRFYNKLVKKTQSIIIEAPEGTLVEGVCLNLTKKPKSVSVKKGDVKILENGSVTNIIFDAFNGQIITIVL